MLSAAGAARVRRPLEKRFEAPVNPAAPMVNPRGWVAVAVGAPPGRRDAYLGRGPWPGSDRAAWVLVPRASWYLMADADLVFLPWVRAGAAAGLLDPDTFGSGQPGLAVSAHQSL